MTYVITTFFKVIQHAGEEILTDYNDTPSFLVLASPEVKAAQSKPVPKTVVFILDRSGSMAGKKIEQAKNSLQFRGRVIHRRESGEHGQERRAPHYGFMPTPN